MLKLHVVVASTRPGRKGRAIGEWFLGHARRHGGLDATLVDLAEVGLPFLDEPEDPATGRYMHEHTKRWSATVDEADAFVFVMPEYNHSFNAPLKNAIDFLHDEWAHKPAGFVSYGGIAGGTRAVQMLKPVLLTLRMVPIPDAVVVPGVAKHFDDGGHFTTNEMVDRSATVMLDELERVGSALQSLREPMSRV